MSEATVADPEVQTLSTPASPASPAVVETPSPQDASPASRGEETPGAKEPSPAPEPLAAPRQLTPDERWAELDAKSTTEGLTAAEAKDYKSLGQNRTDRQAEERQQLATLQAADQRRAQALASLDTQFDTELKAIWSAALDGGTQAHVDLANEKQASLFRSYQTVAASVHQEPVHQDLNARIIRLYGDSARNREWLAASSWQEKTNVLEQAAIYVGRGLGPTEDQRVLSKRDFDDKGRHKDSYKAGQDDLKAVHPEVFGKAGPATNGMSAAIGGAGWRTVSEAEALHVQGKLSNDDMRRIRADSRIPYI